MNPSETQSETAKLMRQPDDHDTDEHVAFLEANKEVNLHATMDAQVWTAEWLRIIAEHPTIPTDEGTMLGWFANAIMCGYDHGRRHEADEQDALLDDLASGLSQHYEARMAQADKEIARLNHRLLDPDGVLPEPPKP